jgi:hypothetical protein
VPEILVSAQRPIVRRESASTMEAIHTAVRGALQLAILEGAKVAVVLRGDPSAGRAARVIHGVPYEIVATSDGRERVYLRVAEGTEQIVLIERIMRVMPASE